jgi:ribosomal protein S27E
MKGNECMRCEGCGQIANDDDGTPWTVWLQLPLESSVAVLSGLVKPIKCPDCQGTGVIVGKDQL